MGKLKVKYIRVSSVGQELYRQQLDEKVYDKIYADTISGSIPMEDRPMGAELVRDIENGKIGELVTDEISRLGRDVINTLRTLKLCEDNGVSVTITNLGISSMVNGKVNDMFKLVFNIVVSLAEAEKKNIAERCNQGRQAARKRGVQFGRPKGWKESKSSFLSKEKPKLIVKYLAKGYKWEEIMKLADVSKTLIYKTKKYMNNEITIQVQNQTDVLKKSKTIESLYNEQSNIEEFDEFPGVKPISGWGSPNQKPTGLAKWEGDKK